MLFICTIWPLVNHAIVLFLENDASNMQNIFQNTFNSDVYHTVSYY